MVAAVNSIENVVTWALVVGSAVLELFALIDAVTRPASAFEAHQKMSKPAWVLILALSLLTCVALRSPIGILSVVGLVAAGVYLADVRPVVSAHRNRG